MDLIQRWLAQLQTVFGEVIGTCPAYTLSPLPLSKRVQTSRQLRGEG